MPKLESLLMSVGDDELITITDPNRLRHFGWTDPLPPSVMASRSLWKRWWREHKAEYYFRVRRLLRELRKIAEARARQR